MNNKKLGNAFEAELCEMLFSQGFWVHNFAQNQAGQPADIIAVRNGKPYLIDAKVCSTVVGFDFRRIESNQNLAMSVWAECRNGTGWFALQLNEQVFMIPHKVLMRFAIDQSRLSPKEIFEIGKPFEKWVLKC